ncbi:MAG TPA: site-specific integrase [Planctomycetaceae bacterium]|jgi:integrase|nr:site-specific integrase [Planctomycetaceae bacterium]
MATTKRISVIVFRPAGRPYFMAQWVDPTTGRKKTRSLGTNIRRDAEREAAKVQDDLRNFRKGDPSRTAWATFRERYEREHGANLAPNTREHVAYMFNTVEKLIGPATLAEMDASAISTFKMRMREAKLRDSSILSHLKSLRAALGWAKRVGMLTTIPEIVWPKDAEEAGGRPITTEEFERLLAQCDRLKLDGAPSWKRLLYGLWWSGLRINEAMHLHWTDPQRLCVDLDGHRPMFKIAKSFNKSRKAERFPMSPEFYEFLMETPPGERIGYVFNPQRRRPLRETEGRLTTDRVSEAIAEIGRAAIIKTKDMDGTPVYASAHDLRRSFGFRWAKRVMPAILQRLMRHSTIKTTLTYYAVQGEDETAGVVWDAYKAQIANDFANGHQKQAEIAEKTANQE